MTTKPKPRKPAAKTAAPKPAPKEVPNGTPTQVSEIERLIARHKVAQAAVEAAIGPEDLPKHLLDAEWGAISDLAEMPCANEAELLEKLRYLLAHETKLSIGKKAPTMNHGYGSVLVALDRHLNPPKKRPRKTA
jgi:hypothetical protein